MLKAFKRDKGDWNEYHQKFLNLMTERKIEDRFSPALFDGACLLCSEATPHNCHRRLVCEYLNGKWGGALKVKHL
jgi:predicted metal-binding protein